ncbi:hypothetical protein TNCV_1125631 [Trichonephila clavipes]|nr:hypothetical protein TNCV_1125631 [Trichonephila clavipes]
MRSHTFEMADNKQLKAVIRGLPTDYDQKEIASELKGFGPQEKRGKQTNIPDNEYWVFPCRGRTFEGLFDATSMLPLPGVLSPLPSL